ncbi:elongation factor P hydroxylase [Salinicola aestuarinus]|uniref:elongation factor P hydroxylase n=1 Tax=Salinicola aestuarinus TaxID=1949082 RepID=UPI002477EFA0|nr:elongation factor P hydroxylase [Salinicola aestuarinus]
MTHRIEDLITLFDALFAESYGTRLVSGDDEPLYLPAGGDQNYHRIIFAHGFFASALHEISHWCIAGAARREQEDYGYWYEPDGRDALQQSEFERVEIAPQAFERLFSEACDKPFRVSVDNLDGADGDPERFAANVAQRAEYHRRHGLPPRADAFYRALEGYYQGGMTLEAAAAHGRRRLVDSGR